MQQVSISLSPSQNISQLSHKADSVSNKLNNVSQERLLEPFKTNSDSMRSRPSQQHTSALSNCWSELNSWVVEPQIDKKEKRTQARDIIERCIKLGRNGTSLHLSNLGLSSLPNVLHHCKFVKHFYCANNELTSIDFTNLKKLETISCSRNRIHKITIDFLSALKDFECDNNLIKNLTIKNLNQLENIDIRNNQINKLQLSDLPELKTLNANLNQLRDLHLTNLLKLSKISCRLNQLTSLTFNTVPKLSHVDCFDNQLETFSVLKLKALNYLNFGRNNHFNFSDQDFAFMQKLPLNELYLSMTQVQWNHIPTSMQINLNLYIDIKPESNVNQEINNPQSTHTSSVHQSSSANATLLKKIYETENLSVAWNKFCAWVDSLPTDAALLKDNLQANDCCQNASAQRFVKNSSHLTYRDSLSGITIKEFLIYSWLAIHDPDQRESHVSIDEAKKSLRNALYEMQRGYNLNDMHTPQDDNGLDNPICATGAFNKISEKLIGIVKNIKHTHINHAVFLLALQAKINEALRSLTFSNSDLEITKNKIAENENCFINELWESIDEKVKNSVIEEFGNTLIHGKTIENLFTEVANIDTLRSYKVIFEPVEKIFKI